MRGKIKMLQMAQKGTEGTTHMQTINKAEMNLLTHVKHTNAHRAIMNWISSRTQFPFLWTRIIYYLQSVQLLSHVQLFTTLWTAASQSSLSITNSQSLLKLMCIESVMPSNHILCHPLLLLPLIIPGIRVFSSESVLHISWPKYQNFCFSISPSDEHSGLISFWMHWSDLLVQGILKSLLPHHSSKVSILWCSAFFMVQLSHPYVTTGETIALTRWTFVGKVMPLLLNLLSRVAITFLTRSKCLLISWLQSQSAVILEPKKIKSVTVSTIFPTICHEVMGTGCHDFYFLNVKF